MIELALAACVVMGASFGGVLFTWKHAGAFIERHLSFLVSFSAGVFLVVAYQLGVELFALTPTPAYGLTWIVIGVVFLGLVFRLIPHFHHHHDEECEHEHAHSRIDARRILLSDMVHNIGDGILLAATFAVSVPLGIATTASVFVHELVQEVSEFFVLKQSGLSVPRILKINFAVSTTILIGALGGAIAIESFEMFEVPLLGIATGSFLVVVLYDLIPHSVRSSSHQPKHLAKHIIWFFVGIALMFAVNQFGVHTHGGEVHDHDDLATYEEDHDHDDHGHDE